MENIKTVETACGNFRIAENRITKYVHGMDLIYNSGFTDNDKTVFLEMTKAVDKSYIHKFDINEFETNITFISYDGIMQYLDEFEKYDEEKAKDIRNIINDIYKPKEVITTENGLQIFENNEFGKVRAIIKNDNIWFVAKDICDALDIKQVSDSLRTLKQNYELIQANIDDVVSTHPIPDSLGRIQNTAIVSETGFYDLISQSRKVSALKFKHWINSDVLPSIRKHGMYATSITVDNMLENPDFAIELLQKYKQEKEEKKKALEKIEIDKPKVEFYEKVGSSNNLITVGTMAKLIHDEGTDIGRDRLFNYLHVAGYLMWTKENPHAPKQQYVKMGLFKTIESTFARTDSIGLGLTTKITTKGQQYFIKHFLKLKAQNIDYRDIIKAHNEKIRLHNEKVQANSLKF